MTRKKQKKTKAAHNKLSVIIDTVTIVPLLFICISLFSMLLIGTAKIEHKCDRLEAKYVECQPRAMLLDRLLNQTRPSYKIDRIFFKRGKQRLTGFTYIPSSKNKKFRWTNNSQFRIYVATSNDEVLQLQHYDYIRLSSVRKKVESLNNFTAGTKGNSNLVFYTTLPRKYLFIYTLVIGFLWLFFIIYLYQPIRTIMLVFKPRE